MPFRKKKRNSVNNGHPNERVIFLGNNSYELNQAQKFANNIVRTSKYTIFNFIPKNLFEQFHRLANVYFLVLIILNWIPELEAFGKESSMIPLISVLIATGLKDLYEDYERHRSDREINHRECLVLEGNEFTKKYWKEIHVGDIIKIEITNQIPADIVLLSTSNEEQNCFVSTTNLDGETNLKMKSAARGPHSKIDGLDPTFNTLVCDLPNHNIYKFTGFITRHDEHKSPLDSIPINDDNVLLRGCTLKNTEWVTGITVYCGRESKVVARDSTTPSKRSFIETHLNFFVMVMLLLLVFFTAFTALGSYVWEVNNPQELVQLIIGPQITSAHLRAFLNFLTSIILFQVMVPIAVYITIDFVHLMQANIIDQDLEMYHEPTNTPAKCRAFNLHEDLGQISYIFSDKTGTLTCNQLEFSQCSIMGEKYNAPNRNDPEDRYIQNLDVTVSQLKNNPNESLNYFMLCLSLCNTAIIDHFQSSSTTQDSITISKYQSQSPDEVAFVSTAAKCGYVLKTRSTHELTIEIFGESHKFEILAVFPFTSERKRMSIMLKDSNQNIILFTKGADEVIFDRLATTPDHFQLSKLHLHEFSVLGLRTLCFGYRIIDDQEFSKWKINEASNSLHKRDELMNEFYEQFEQGFHLLGITGIEDKLQDFVPETISVLLGADIKIWVLTGDMQNTAINIAYACNLLSDSLHQYILNSEKEDECLATFESFIEEASVNINQKFALIIHGKSIYHLLNTEEHQKKFFYFTAKSQFVLCFRVSPLQKAQVVHLVQKFTNQITLAIGDGANDVEMIQRAHIGVGITGQEGRQAVMSSDFAIAQFSYLKDLLLVHGHWSYYRLSYFIIYTLYKNAIFVTLLFMFQFVCGFSSQTPISDLDLIFYCFMYTLTPGIIFAIYDQDLKRQFLISNPIVYKIGQTNQLFTKKLFFHIVLEMFWQSIVIVYLPVGIYWAFSPPLYSLGIPILTSVVFVITLELSLETNYWTWIHHVAYWGTIGLFFLLCILFGIGPDSMSYLSLINELQNPIYYFTCLLVIPLGLLPRFVIKAYSQFYHPSLFDLAREQSLKKTDYQESCEALKTVETFQRISLS